MKRQQGYEVKGTGTVHDTVCGWSLSQGPCGHWSFGTDSSSATGSW